MPKLYQSFVGKRPNIGDTLYYAARNTVKAAPGGVPIGTCKGIHGKTVTVEVRTALLTINEDLIDILSGKNK